MGLVRVRLPVPQFLKPKLMNTPQSNPRSRGFTLIEVLTALGLCAFLAVSTASAISFASRAERIATRHGNASLLLPSLYAAQRLRPDERLETPGGWSTERTTEIEALPNDELAEWYEVVLRDTEREMSPITLRILNEAP
jgi:prepilin-type N-terminal cleavage/methylation domain-containing protein